MNDFNLINLLKVQQCKSNYLYMDSTCDYIHKIGFNNGQFNGPDLFNLMAKCDNLFFTIAMTHVQDASWSMMGINRPSNIQMLVMCQASNDPLNSQKPCLFFWIVAYFIFHMYFLCCVSYVYHLFVFSHCLCFIACCLHLFAHGKLFLVFFYLSVMAMILALLFGFQNCRVFFFLVICIHFYFPIFFYIQCISNISNFWFVMSTLSVSSTFFFAMHYRLICLLLDLIYISKFPMNYMLLFWLMDTILLTTFFVSFGFGCELCGEIFITFFWARSNW